MSKAILIVDLPDNVNVDKMCKTPVSLTFQLKSCKQIWYEKGYLRPIPQKKDFFEEYMKVDRSMNKQKFDKVQEELRQQILGYNYCIDEILGEKE